MCLNTKRKDELVIMYKSLDDSAIDLQRLEKCLAEIAQKITESNKHNLTDINIICEEVFGQILNRLFEINLIAISLEINRNFPAVDLIDYDNKIAYQVTTQGTKEKINHTIEVFNRHIEIFDKVDELNILFLKKVDDKLYENEDVDLHNGKKFSYENNILDFSKLIKEIEKKSQTDENIFVKIYRDISMLYDSGRLNYSSIVQKTNHFNLDSSQNYAIHWRKGFGDVLLSAFIPTRYGALLSAELEFRNHNISGFCITFDEATLLRSYFSEREVFEKEHFILIENEEDALVMRFQNEYIVLKRYTAYHVYQLFCELKKEYLVKINQLNKILGTDGLERVGDKYLLKVIDQDCWEKIIYFARKHNWMNETNDKWNIFHVMTKYKICIMPPISGKTDRKIAAIITVESIDGFSQKLNLYWELDSNYKNSEFLMPELSKELEEKSIWKADYVLRWMDNELINAVNEFYERDNLKNKKLFNQLIKLVGARLKEYFK